jgi:hypothetical protein
MTVFGNSPSGARYANPSRLARLLYSIRTDKAAFRSRRHSLGHAGANKGSRGSFVGVAWKDSSSLARDISAHSFDAHDFRFGAVPAMPGLLHPICGLGALQFGVPTDSVRKESLD